MYRLVMPQSECISERDATRFPLAHSDRPSFCFVVPYRKYRVAGDESGVGSAAGLDLLVVGLICSLRYNVT